MKIDTLNLATMHSGHLCLELSNDVGWDDFSDYATELALLIRGNVFDKNDSPDTRIWKFNVQGCELRIVYEDYPQLVSVESHDSAGDQLLRKIFHDLGCRA